jgi:hypothetical protein
VFTCKQCGNHLAVGESVLSKVGHRVARHVRLLATISGLGSPDRIGAAWVRETEMRPGPGPLWTGLRSQVSGCNIYFVGGSEMETQPLDPSAWLRVADTL